MRAEVVDKKTISDADLAIVGERLIFPHLEYARRLLDRLYPPMGVPDAVDAGDPQQDEDDPILVEGYRLARELIVACGTLGRNRRMEAYGSHTCKTSNPCVGTSAKGDRNPQADNEPSDSSDITRGHLQLMEEDEDDSLNAIKQETQVRVAIGSGPCRNVTHPKTLPGTVKVEPNISGTHFSGADGEVIETYGECVTSIEGDHGTVGCRWDIADVTRPLHSVSQMPGPADGDGNVDVLFNNKRCAAVPPGVLEAVMKQIGTPIA
jgi:hypothetical protein